jgi:uncharacterized membrane protein YedE/YeeE
VKAKLVALVAGLVFGVGLALSGMTQPSKVFGFLDLTGAFDASLLLVMASGIAVLLVPQWIARRSRAPLFAERFPSYGRTELDARSIGGAAIFGVGWALGGFCPGPALVSLASGMHAALVFVPAMAAGMVAFRLWEAWMKTAPSDESGQPAGGI